MSRWGRSPVYRLQAIRIHQDIGEWWHVATLLVLVRDMGDHVQLGSTWSGYCGRIPMTAGHAGQLMHVARAGLAEPNQSFRRARAIWNVSQVVS